MEVGKRAQRWCLCNWIRRGVTAPLGVVASNRATRWLFVWLDLSSLCLDLFLSPATMTTLGARGEIRCGTGSETRVGSSSVWRRPVAMKA